MPELAPKDEPNEDLDFEREREPPLCSSVPITSKATIKIASKIVRCLISYDN
jgi:hypothetical protein